MKKLSLIVLITAFLFIWLAPVFSEEKAQENKPSELKKEIYKLKYIKYNDIMMLVQNYLSREGRIFWAADSRIISISDVPENVEKILAIIKEIDTKPADLLFTVQLLLGSETGEEKLDEYLKNDPIVKELTSFLKYKNYSLLDTSLIRALDDKQSEIRLGKNAEFTFSLRPKYIREEKGDFFQVEVELNQEIKLSNPEKVGDRLTVSYTRQLIESNLTLKHGEKTVVGVSKMDGGDKALILIISGKIIK